MLKFEQLLQLINKEEYDAKIVVEYVLKGYKLFSDYHI